MSEVTLSDQQMEMIDSSETDYSDLKALFINCTLKRVARAVAHRGPGMDLSMEIMRRNGVEVEISAPSTTTSPPACGRT